MTGWAWVAVVVISAAVATLTTLMVDAMRRSADTWDTDRAAINTQINEDRAAQTRTVTHIRRGGKGACVVCGVDPDDGAT